MEKVVGARRCRGFTADADLPWPLNPIFIGAMKRDVGAELEVEITAPTTLEFQIAVAPHPNAEVSESLSFVLDGKPVQPLEISGVHGNRIHKMDAAVGILKVDYAATIVGPDRPGAGDRVRPVDVPSAEPLRRGRQVLRLRRNRIRQLHRFDHAVGEGVLVGGHPAELCARLQRPDRRSGGHLARWRRGMPRLRTPCCGAATGRQRAGARCVGVCAGPVSDGLPCGCRGVRRGALAGGRRHAAWRRDRPWCASPPDAMPPTSRSWTTTRVRSL